MTDKKTKKPNEPELIEDKELDETSGGLVAAVNPTTYKIEGPTTVESSPLNLSSKSLNFTRE